MRLAIMQPYLFPYLGYFQLVRACDTFVFYDDVAFIKQGWVNRNRLLTSQGPQFFTVPVHNISSFVSIRDTQVSDRPAGWRDKLRKTFEQAYRKAPHFASVWQWAEPILGSPEPSMGALARQSVRAVADYLGLAPRWVESSSIYGNSDLKAQARVLDICRREGCDRYVNMAGGSELYDHASFVEAGFQLEFLVASLPPYTQYKGDFVPGLSILDVLFFNSPDAVRQMLTHFELR